MTLGCLMSFMVEISRLICRKKQQQRERVKKIINWPGPDWDDKADRPNQTATHTFQRKAGGRDDDETRRPWSPVCYRQSSSAAVLTPTGGPASWRVPT